MNSASVEATTPRLRADLQWTRHDDRSRWIARDPLTTSFYTFSDLERQAAKLMTGRLSVAEIVQALRRACPTAGIDQRWLLGLLGRMQWYHLLVPSSRNDALRVAAAGQRLQRRRGWQTWLSPLAIRIPLFDPTGLLNFLRPLALVLFHPLVVAAWLVAGVAMGLLVVRQLLSGGWGDALNIQSLQGDRWLLLFVCYLAAKSLHELGHGLACVRQQARCHEIGVMLLCLAPCLYCDTTDSWKLSSKWQRAGIAAAGIYVEWILATLAAGVWLVTQPGAVHLVAASMMVVCSLGTLLVNSNPLLKYDGYYVLSDLWGVPNLSDQGREALRGMIYWALTGRPLSRSHFDASPGWLAAYAALAAVYRWFILGAILWLCWSWLVPLGLGLLAALVTILLAVGVGVGQYRAVRSLIQEIASANSFRPLRWLVLVSLLGLGVAAIAAWPLPVSLRARGVTDFADKQPLFASQTAELVYAADPDQWLPAGSRLLQFDAPESQLQLCQLEGEMAVLQEEVRQLQLRSAMDPATAYQLPAKTEQLHQLQARQRLLARELAQLRHVAPEGGYLLSEPQPVAAPLAAFRDDRFARNPLDPSSLGITCDRSTRVGWFSPKQEMVLEVLVAERDIKRLQLGRPAAICWDSYPREVASGRIVRIAPDAIAEMPSELVGDPSLLSARDDRGRYLPETPHYEVTVRVDLPTPRLPRRAPASVRFELPPQTLWQQWVQWLRQNLKPWS